MSGAPCRSVEAALAFIEAHGVVLVSAKGKLPRMTEAIAGEPIKGSWWGHPAGKQIFAILEAVCDTGQVLVCRMVDGKLTLVHSRLWPLLACVADQFAPEQICQVTQEHTSSGRHLNHSTPYPDWMPAAIRAQGELAERAQALTIFGAWLAR